MLFLMKLMTYNILNGAKDNLAKVIAVINRESPDFLGINEANGFDDNNQKIIKEFAAKIGLPFFDLAKCGDGDDYHIAVFSKQPFEKIEHLDGFARAAIAVDIKTDFGTISIIATHLTPYTEALRMEEVKKILSHDHGSSYKVLMGDLNSLSRADDYDPKIVATFNEMQTKKFTADGRLLFHVTDKLLQPSYVDPAILADKQKVFTAPTSINEYEAHNNMRLDYILVSPQLQARLSVYGVIKDELTNVASDHFPVIVELR